MGTCYLTTAGPVIHGQNNARSYDWDGPIRFCTRILTARISISASIPWIIAWNAWTCVFFNTEGPPFVSTKTYGKWPYKKCWYNSLVRKEVCVRRNSFIGWTWTSSPNTKARFSSPRRKIYAYFDAAGIRTHGAQIIIIFVPNFL
jgi:hypothetical protein